MMQVLPMTFGERLRELRKAADMTQEELSKASGVTTSAIKDLEQRSSRDPKLSTLCALARALNVTLEAFNCVCDESGESKESPPPSPDKRKK